MKVTGNSQHGFMNGKPRQTNLIAFYDNMTSLVDEARTEDIVYFNFSKAHVQILEQVAQGGCVGYPSLEI